MDVTAAQVKELRQKTGAGMMDCKKALVEAKGDMSSAVEFLQVKGLAAAKKRADRVAAEGYVGSYIHHDGKTGVLLEVNCETDFVAKNDLFQEFVKHICMHIAAAKPEYVNADEVPEAERASQAKIFRAQALESGKPEKIVDKISEGRLSKWLQDICLVDQPFVMDTELTVKDKTTQLSAKLGENIVLRRFARFTIGESSAE